MAKLDYKYYDYQKIKKLKPLTRFEDVKEGVMYHIPPTILYDRKDFIVNEKINNKLIGIMRESNGEWHDATLYNSEISMGFLVEKQKIGK